MRQPRGCLTSAAGCLHILSGALRNVDGCEILGASWVDPDSGIKVVLCCSHTDGYVVALSDLASVGTEDMEPHYTLLEKGIGG